MGSRQTRNWAAFMMGLPTNAGASLAYIDERFNRALGPFDPSIQLPITSAAQAAYATSPIPELAASAFRVTGGSTYAGVGSQPRNWCRTS